MTESYAVARSHNALEIPSNSISLQSKPFCHSNILDMQSSSPLEVTRPPVALVCSLLGLSRHQPISQEVVHESPTRGEFQDTVSADLDTLESQDHGESDISHSRKVWQSPRLLLAVLRRRREEESKITTKPNPDLASGSGTLDSNDSGRDYAMKVSVDCPKLRLSYQCEKSSRCQKLGINDCVLRSETLEGSEDVPFAQLRRATFQAYGKWKTWVPYYDVKEVQEIRFRFDNVTDSTGLVPIHITYRAEEEIGNILADARKVIDDGPTAFDLQYGDACWGAPYHTKECRDLTEEFGVECRSDSVVKAETRIRAISRRHWLKESFQRPQEAKARTVLEGMAQEAFVYKTLHNRIRLPRTRDDLCASCEVRGVYVLLGWDTQSILRHLKVGLIWMTFALAVIWLGTFIWAERFGDWGTALAFGQLLAATIGVIMVYT